MSTRLNSARTSQPPRSSDDDRKDAAIQEIRKCTHLADLLREQVELIPELDRRQAAVANLGEISKAMESSLSILQPEMEQPSSAVVAMAASASYSSDGGTGERTGGAVIARTRRVRHRRGRNGAEVPIKEIVTQAPENDRFHWRKYGEKNILNDEYPRLYYKCGYSEDHRCPAKKYVQQRSNSSPPLFMVTLINEHTCDTLFRDDHPSSSSSASQVLDFTKASISSPPLMAAAPGLKNEEDNLSSVSMHNYSYDEYLSSLLPTMSPDGDQVDFSPGPMW